MEDQIDRLLQELSLDEKIGLIAGADLWHSQAVERLGIPALKMTDGPNGVRGENRDTHPVTSASFPVGTAMAATWNLDLVEQVGRALAQEVRSKGAHVLLGPTVNIHRTPLAGRNFECFSEDPHLAARMAVAYIRGVQSEGVVACVKHFVCNDQEHERFTVSAEVDERTLHEIYLPPFRAAICEAGAWALMSAYNRVNGIYASENAALLRELLKGEWGFDGLVISDWYGTYSQRAAAAGCDLEMPGPARWMGADLRDALLDGSLPGDILDDKVRRLLRTLVRTRAFEATGGNERSEDRPEHRALIRRVGAEAIVLLKNEGGLLPLRPGGAGRIAVIGQLAAQVSFQGGGSSQVAPHYVASPLDALRERYGDRLSYARGYDIRRQPPALEADWLTGWEVVVEYFRDLDLRGDPARRAKAARVDLSWFGEFDSGWDLNHFSLRMRGGFSPPASGEYTFTFALTGRGRLFLDGQLRIDLWDGPSSQQQRELSLILDAGRRYEFVIEYISDMALRWRNVRLGVAPAHSPDLFQEAIDLAASADVAVVVAGLTPEWEAEGFDRPDLDLPGRQNELIRRVAAVNPNTVVVINAGSPLLMPWLEAVPAVLQMWYLGQESGHALADVLLGEVCPSGKLPTTFPRRLEDNPTYSNYPGEHGMVRYEEGILVGYRHYDRNGIEPLFPFGHGLSYTTFVYADLRLSAARIGPGETLTVSVRVRNTGKRPGMEVVQLYLRDPRSRLTRPEKELKAFAKLLLDPGEDAKVRFEICENDLAFYDPEAHDWIAEAGEFVVQVGSSSRDIRLSGTFAWSSS